MPPKDVGQAARFAERPSNTRSLQSYACMTKSLLDSVISDDERLSSHVQLDYYAVATRLDAQATLLRGRVAWPAANKGTQPRHTPTKESNPPTQATPRLQRSPQLEPSRPSQHSRRSLHSRPTEAEEQAPHTQEQPEPTA